MGIFSRFAVRSLSANRVRTAVSVIGIALACALITAIFTSVATVWHGLYQRTVSEEGTWQVSITNLSPSGVDGLRSLPEVLDSTVVAHYGSAAYSASDARNYGVYLNLESYPQGQGGLIVPPSIVEGRAPAGSGEILLPSYLRGGVLAPGAASAHGADGAGIPSGIEGEGSLSIGSAVTLSLGTRVYDDGADGAAGAVLTPDDPPQYSDDGTGLVEHLDGIQPGRTFEVVGFYDPSSWRTGSGNAAFTGPSGNIVPISCTAYATTSLASYEDIEGLDEALGPEALPDGMPGHGLTPHSSLLRYEGVLDDRAIWSTLGSMAAVLAAIVMVASISLIYNAFAISVSERTRQFGLLASLGASRRQLRRTVYAEAAVLAAVGIAAGLALGLMGTWIVFTIMGEGLDMLFGTATGRGIVVSPEVIVLAGALSLVTIAVSAWVPAWRAGRSSAIDAIRQTRDVKLGARERRRRNRTGALDRARLALGGVPELIAHRNLTRSRGKGRIAVASLAISVALLVISGAFGSYMQVASGVVSTMDADLSVSLSVGRPSSLDVAGLVDELDGVYGRLAETPGVSRSGMVLARQAYGSFDGAMVSGSEAHQFLKGGDGALYSAVNVVFMDDASWRSYLGELGIRDVSAYTDPARPRAIALNSQLGRSSGTYSLSHPFDSAGNVTLCTQMAAHENESFSGFDRLSDGSEEVGALYNRFDPADHAYDGSVVYPLGESVLASTQIPIGALADERPTVDAGMQDSSPTLYLPISALPSLNAGIDTASARSTDNSLAMPFAFANAAEATDYSAQVQMYFDAEDPAQAEEELETTIRQGLGDIVDPSSLDSVFNLAQATYQARLMFLTIQTFTTCFAVVCGLIAVANVFNTLSTSIILRRREFAVLKSVGMGERAFRRMIARECLSYAVRGLAAGLLLAGMVSYALYCSMNMSFSGVGFMMPPLWIGLSVAGVLVVLIASVAYALNRCRVTSIVEALRDDAL